MVVVVRDTWVDFGVSFGLPQQSGESVGKTQPLPKPVASPWWVLHGQDFTMCVLNHLITISGQGSSHRQTLSKDHELPEVRAFPL